MYGPLPTAVVPLPSAGCLDQFGVAMAVTFFGAESGQGRGLDVDGELVNLVADCMLPKSVSPTPGLWGSFRSSTATTTASALNGSPLVNLTPGAA
jgi:hypothetical protein